MKSKAIKNVILYSTLFVILIIFLVFILPNLRGNNENNTESSSDKGGSKIENTTNCYPIEGNYLVYADSVDKIIFSWHQ